VVSKIRIIVSWSFGEICTLDGIGKEVRFGP
jgi:hypothetical protein